MKSILGRTKTPIPVMLMVFIAMLFVSCQADFKETKSNTPDTGEIPVAVSPDTQDPAYTLTPIEELGITGVAIGTTIAFIMHSLLLVTFGKFVLNKFEQGYRGSAGFHIISNGEST